MKRRAVAVAIGMVLACAAGCAERGSAQGDAGAEPRAGTDRNTGTGTDTDTDTGTDAATDAGSRADGGATPSTSTLGVGAFADLPEGEVERALRTGRIVSLAPTHRRGKGASFLARLEGDRDEVLEASLHLAPRALGTHHRRALAFARLARALGSDVAAPVAWRHVGVGELGALTPVAAHPALERTLAIQNDGTIDALLELEPPAGTRSVRLDGSEARLWQRWAASATPVEGEDPALLRGWVELLMLDWLAGNGARRGVRLDARSARPRALLAVENGAAFPQRYDAGASDSALARLREVVRFPAGSYGALRLLERDTARHLFARGDFQGWLLSPRVLLGMDERRLTLLSLMEARFAEHGRAAVESLR